MTLERSTYEQALSTGAETIAAVVEASPGHQVPNCPGWDVGDLARHVGSLYMRVREQVRRRSSEAVRSSDLPPAPTGRALGPWTRQAADGLLQALASVDDDAPAGRWRDREVPAGFWRRRMAHETAIHRVDVEDALGLSVTLDGGLAVDGVDEVLEIFLPFSIDTEAWPPSGALWLVRADGPEHWWVEPASRDVHVQRGAVDGASLRDRPPGEATRVEAPASELFLVCWGRRLPPAEAVTGGPEVLEHWLRVFGW